MSHENSRPRGRAIGRTVTLLALAISTGVLLSGCSFPWDIGQHEADRLGRVVDDLPGVESAESTGTTNNITYPAAAMTDVTMSGDATPEQLEAVLLGWRAEANPNDELQTMSKGISVAFRSTFCTAVAWGEAPVEQIKDTATFLPALCAAVPGGTIVVADGEDGEDVRRVTIESLYGSPEGPADVEQLRTLPGAVTPRDDWEVDGVEHRWGDFDY